jgi:hypothetical protein
MTNDDHMIARGMAGHDPALHRGEHVVEFRLHAERPGPAAEVGLVELSLREQDVLDVEQIAGSKPGCAARRRASTSATIDALLSTK